MNLILQLSQNLIIMLINAFVAIKHWLINLPYYQITVILITGYFVYRLMLFEVEEIKSPHTKLSRRRL